MTKQLRFVALFVILAFVLALVPAAFAQDGTFGLSDEDFALLTDANANSSAAETLAYNFNLALNVTGIEDAEVSADISGTGVLGLSGSPVFSMVTTGSATSNGDTTPTELEVRLVGDMIYWNVGEGWQGSAVEDAMSGAMGSAGNLPINPADLMSGDMGDMGDMGGMMGDLATLDLSSYVGLERLDDMDGAAHFNLSVDVAGLLASEELSGIFGMALGGAMGGGSDMSPEQAAQMGQMFGMMFGDATFEVDQYVNLETELVQRTVLSINLPLESLMGTPGAAVDLMFDISLSSYNEPISVEVPENVEMAEIGG
ncbi:MAG: hypothetical protein IAE80_15250 [Anaerolinea sp.]|nr:hypothetical protein [Anaerolinea sp.]